MTTPIKSPPENRRTFGAGRIVASPRARRAMRQKNLDGANLRGSGPNGRILEADVLAAKIETVAPLQARELLHLRAEINATRLQELLKKFAPHAQKKHAVKLELSHLLIHAMAAALRAHPQANRVRHNGAFVQAQSIDIGSEKDGVPFVIANSDKLNLVEIARADSSAEIAATSVQLAPSPRIDEWTGTLAENASSVLAVGSLAPRAFVVGGALTVCLTLRLCFSCDQSAISRTIAAEFFETIIEFLEQPEAVVFS